MARPTTSPEKEYERFNPGGGPPGQQEERAQPNPKTTRDDGRGASPEARTKT